MIFIILPDLHLLPSLPTQESNVHLLPTVTQPKPQTRKKQQIRQKTSLQKGEVEIIFKANIIKDYEKRWEDKPFWKMMRGVYDKYVIRTTMEQYEDQIVSKRRRRTDKFWHNCIFFVESTQKLPFIPGVPDEY